MAIDLPSFIEVRETPGAGRGLFTKKPVKRNDRIFRSEPYAVAVAGVTRADVGSVCHHCMAPPADGDEVVLCGKCRVVGYCSRACREAGRSLHEMECVGIAKMEELRHRAKFIVPSTSEQPCWPPTHALLVGRAINKRILTGDRSVSYLASRKRQPSPENEKRYANLKKYIRCLVPSNVTEKEIYETACTMDANASVVWAPQGASTLILCVEQSLINHMCRPNCLWESESGKVSVVALDDLKPGDQLGFSYLTAYYRLSVRDIRRKKLKDERGFDCHCFVCSEEERVGSKFWLLNEQKKSLVSPWSHQHADKVMKAGWELLCKYTDSGAQPREIVKSLEAAISLQRSVLDKCNAVILLTTKMLLLNYGELGEYRKAVEQLKLTSLTALLQYGTVQDVDFFLYYISRCLLNMGREEDSLKVEAWTIDLILSLPSLDGLATSGFWREGLSVSNTTGRKVWRLFEEALVSGSFKLPSYE